MVTSGRGLESLAPWIAGVALAVPVLVAFYPPMSDLAFHEASIGILRDFHDGRRFPPGLYELNLGEPNQLFHLAGWALSWFVPTRWAVKLLVAAAVGGIPVCAARLARHTGSHPLAALLLAPIALGWLFSAGLAANLVGLAALLALLPVLDRFAAEPTARRTVAVLGGTALLYFAHMAMMLVYGAVALGLAVLRPWSWRRTTWSLCPLFATLAAVVAQGQWQRRYLSLSVAVVPRRWDGFARKVLVLPSMFTLDPGRAAQLGMTALCVSTLGAFLWLRARERRTAGEVASAEDRAPSRALAWGRPRAWALAHRWEVFGAAGLLAYFASPLWFDGAMLVYQRWFAPGFAMVAACSAPRHWSSRAAQLARSAVYALPLASLVVAAPAFADSDRQYRQLEALLPEIDPGSAVAQVVLGPDDPSRSYSLGCATGRVLATRGGRLAYSFTDSPVSPAYLALPYQWEGAAIRMNAGDLRPSHDLRMFRYLVALANDAGAARLASRALSEDARLVGVSGDWLLFESRHEVIPLRSPPLKFGKPPPESLSDRAARVARSSIP